MPRHTPARPEHQLLWLLSIALMVAGITAGTFLILIFGGPPPR